MMTIQGTRTTSKVIYPTLEEMHSLDPGFSPLVNVIALVYDLRAPRALGRRGRKRHTEYQHILGGLTVSLTVAYRRCSTQSPPCRSQSAS
jgi:hypothetical protein